MFAIPHRRQAKAGFTLLELLVVISIIGILIAMGMAAYSTAQKKSRDARRKGDIKQVQNAFEQYYAANASVYASCTTMAAANIQGGMPNDPKNSGVNVYTCTVDTTNNTYCICARLENAGTGNASANSANGVCTYGTGDYYCTSNLQ